MSKPKRRSNLHPKGKGFGSEPLLVKVSKAQALMRRGHWSEAAELLKSLDQQYPDRVEVVQALAGLYRELGDAPQYQFACSRLQQLQPDHPESLLLLASSCLGNLRPILALKAFEEFLERWPNHQRSNEIREMIADLEETKNKIIVEVGMSPTDSLNVALLHEMGQSYLEQGQYEKGRQALQELLTICPISIPDLNNLSLIYFLESNIEQAIAITQQVLNLEPNNIHALSNLTRYFYLNRQTEEAQAVAERMKALPCDIPDHWLKKAEALSFLGDDQGILDVFQEAEQAEGVDPEEISPFLYHLVGVAAMRLGQDKQARQYWQKALELDPQFELAHSNLEDSYQLISERHGPWPFHLNSWIAPQAFRDLESLYSERQLNEEHSEDEASVIRESVRGYLEKHPEIVHLIPALLDRGDPQGRHFVLGLVVMGDTPETKVLLQDFALSQRGPDKMRQQAAQIVSQAELFPPGPVRLWLNGEWQESNLLGFEIHDEQSTPHSPQVQKLARDAVIAMKTGQAEKAQRLLKQALKIEPDAADLQYNLAGTYELQGASAQAFDLVQKLHEQHPDYLFGRIGLAQFYITIGQLDEAEELIEPLTSRKRFHYSEFDGFCNIQIELAVAQKKLDVARSWLQMWAMVNPDTPGVEKWQRKLSQDKTQTRLSAEHIWTQL